MPSCAHSNHFLACTSSLSSPSAIQNNQIEQHEEIRAMKKQALRDVNQLSRAVWLFGAAVIAAIIIGSALSIILSREKEIETWRKQMSSMSLMLSEQTSQTVFSACLVLNSITADVQHIEAKDQTAFRARLSTPEVHSMLVDRIHDLPQVDVVTIIAANGDIINFTHAYPAPTINVANRDYFKAYLENPNLGVFISEAVRNKFNHKWTFYLSRRLNDAHGNFKGLVIVGLSVDAFTDFYSRVANNVGAETTMSLYRNDLTLLARTPRADNMIGEVNKRGFVYQAYQAMKAQGKHDSVVFSDQEMFLINAPVNCLIALRTTENYPLLVSLTIPEDVVLASWRHYAMLIIAVAITSALLLLLGIVILTRNLKQREQIEQNLRKSVEARKQMEQQQRIAAIAFESQDAMLVTDQNGLILRVNKSFKQITGYTSEEVIGKNPRMLVSDRQNETFYAAMWESISNTGACKGEVWYQRKNGEIYPVYLNINAVKDEDGRVSNYVGSFADITLRKSAEEEIRTLAFYDHLTGLPNRRLLQDRLKHALASSVRSGKTGALLFLDLDNFKALNDTLGHDFGDMLLQQVAQRLTACLREGDTIARLGGDEFVVILEGINEQTIEAAEYTETVGEKIIAALNVAYQLGSHAQHSTPSIGATLFTGHQQSIDSLLKQADIAMYQAKKAGRNTLRFFDPEMQQNITARVKMENELRKAVEQHEFALYYQVQVDAVYPNRPVGAEALIRWLHPERGCIAPLDFISLAEETGLILPIGQWVLETACRQLVSWAENVNTAHLTLSVNVSAQQFHQHDFVDAVLAVIAHTGVNPRRLKLELTESMLLQDIDAIILKISTLQRLGIGFSLDDFGTGYSSLSYLSRLPLDQLKIDKSFVMAIEISTDAVAICSATINLAHSLRLKVVAEGIETQKQSSILSLGHHCDYFQGYLYGKPESIEQFEAKLK